MINKKGIKTKNKGSAVIAGSKTLGSLVALKRHLQLCLLRSATSRSMAALDSRLKQFKLETTFHDGHVIHTTYPTDLATQQREVAVKSKWIEKEKIEARGPSAVTLEENEEGQLRAVKSLNKDFYPTNFIKELRIMIHLRNVCFFHENAEN